MRGSFWDKFPSDILHGTEIGDDALSLLILEESDKLFISRVALTKFVPWSLHINDGLPLRAINRRRAAINASVERSEVNSR